MSNLSIRVKRSNRKTLSLEIKEDLSLTVRAPRYVSDEEIRSFIASHLAWIEKHQEKMRQRNEATASIRPLTSEELNALADKAMQVIPGRVEHFAKILHVTYGRITIRNQQTRWGSCSSKGNLNFNCLLMLTPDHILDYIVVHELCHRLEMNHSARFWTKVATVIPDYRDCEKWLKEHGSAIMKKNR